MILRVWKDYLYNKLLNYFNVPSDHSYRRERHYVITYVGSYSEYITVWSVTALAGYVYACVVGFCNSDKWQKVKVCGI